MNSKLCKTCHEKVIHGSHEGDCTCKCHTTGLISKLHAQNRGKALFKLVSGALVPLIARIAFLSVLSLFLSSKAKAYEFSQNPDRFPSIGFNVSNQSLSGAHTEENLPGSSLVLPFFGHGSTDDSSIGGDLRLPVTQSITFSFFYDHVEHSETTHRQDDVYKVINNYSGDKYGFSMRLYLNH